jgi:perosamine synthetase
MIPLIKPYIPPSNILIPKLENILYSGYISEGDSVYEFENKFSKLINNPYCISLNSGTAALHIALLILGVCKGDEVISTALTAEPTNTTIALTGARVIFADVDLLTGLISPQSIEKNINSKTKAIMVVHYAGMVCDMDKINEISKKYNIPVIEDAAHSFLSKYKDKYVGSNSRFTCFSFQAIKHITTIDGGMLCLKNDEDYKRAKKLRWFGLDKKIPRLENNITEPGYKYHMNNVNASIGIVQLENLDNNVFKYISNGKFFDQNLINKDLNLIPYYKNTEPSYWLYTLVVKRREDFIQHLYNNGITASPLHLRNDRHTIFKTAKGSLPNLDIFYESFVHIPCGWWLNDNDLKKITSVINKGW